MNDVLFGDRRLVNDRDDPHRSPHTGDSAEDQSYTCLMKWAQRCLSVQVEGGSIAVCPFLTVVIIVCFGLVTLRSYVIN